MTGRTDPVDGLELVLGTVGDLVAEIRPDQWAAATPCPEWTVRRLVNHMILGHRVFVGALRGATHIAPGALEPTTDLLGDDPAAVYRGATAELLTEFCRPGALDATVVVPVGPVPGIAAVRLRTVEEIAHGWDLARAIGRRVTFPGDLVESQLEFTRAKLADVPPERSPFAPAQPIADDAPPLDRLLALLGRPVAAYGGAPS